MKIKKCHKLVCNLYDEEKYVAHIRTLKQALNHVILFLKVHKLIQFNQKALFKSYFEKDFFKVMNNAIVWKNYGKCKKAQGY